MMGAGRANLWESLRRLFTPGASDREAGRTPHASRAALLCLLAAIVIWFLLTMGEVHTATLPFRVVLFTPPPGEALVAPLPEEVMGKVEGGGFQLLQLFFDTPRIELRASSPTVDLMDQANTLPSSVDVLSLTPRTLSLETDELVERRIPVDLRAVFRPAPTYSFTNPDSVVYTPDSVTVAGAARVVNRLRSWPSEVRSFTNLRDSLQVTIPLVDTLQGYVTVEPQEVVARVGVAAFTEVERIVEVTISSAPSSEQVARLTPTEVRVRFNVLLSQYREALEADIRAFVSFDDIRRDNTNRLRPTLVLPDNLLIRDVDVTPATVGYYTVQAGRR